MKKTCGLVILALLAGTLALAQEAPTVNVQQGDYVFILGLRGPWSLFTEAAIRATAARFEIPVKILIPAEPMDEDETAALLRAAIDAKPTGIAIALFHPSAFDALIQEAVDKGIIVVGALVDDWTNNPRQAYVGYDWISEAEKLGTLIVKDLHPRTKVLIVMNDAPDIRLTKKVKGLTQVFKRYNISWSILQSDTDNLEENLDLYWGLHEGEFQALVGLCDPETRAIAKLVESRGLTDLVTGGFAVTFETLGYLKTGGLDVVVKVAPELEGALPIENLYYSHIYGVSPSEIVLSSKVLTAADYGK